MSKEGYQPIKTKKTIKVILQNIKGSVHMKKAGYTWEDLDRSYWEGFDKAKTNMEKRIKILEKQLNKKICDELCLKKNSAVSEQIVQTTHHWLSACEKISGLEQEKCELLEIIRKYYKYNPSCEYSYEDIDNEAKQFLENKEIK